MAIPTGKWFRTLVCIIPHHLQNLHAEDNVRYTFRTAQKDEPSTAYDSQAIRWPGRQRTRMCTPHIEPWQNTKCIRHLYQHRKYKINEQHTKMHSERNHGECTETKNYTECIVTGSHRFRQRIQTRKVVKNSAIDHRNRLQRSEVNISLRSKIRLLSAIIILHLIHAYIDTNSRPT